MILASEVSDGCILCPRCGGEQTYECSTCGGNGEVERECDMGHTHSTVCDDCNEGLVDCWDCDGAGEVQDPDLNTDIGL